MTLIRKLRHLQLKSDKFPDRPFILDAISGIVHNPKQVSASTVIKLFRQKPKTGTFYYYIMNIALNVFTRYVSYRGMYRLKGHSCYNDCATYLSKDGGNSKDFLCLIQFLGSKPSSTSIKVQHVILLDRKISTLKKQWQS